MNGEEGNHSQHHQSEFHNTHKREMLCCPLFSSIHVAHQAPKPPSSKPRKGISRSARYWSTREKPNTASHISASLSLSLSKPKSSFILSSLLSGQPPSDSLIHCNSQKLVEAIDKMIVVDFGPKSLSLSLSLSLNIIL